MRNTTRTVYIEHEGEKIPLAEFCEKYGITYDNFVTRHLKRGFSTDEIIQIWKYRNGDHPGYYSMAEAEEIYKVGRQSLSHWIKSGKLKAEKVGNSWFIPYGQLVN
jgi:hypothetical protein